MGTGDIVPKIFPVQTHSLSFLLYKWDYTVDSQSLNNNLRYTKERVRNGPKSISLMLGLANKKG